MPSQACDKQCTSTNFVYAAALAVLRRANLEARMDNFAKMHSYRHDDVHQAGRCIQQPQTYDFRVCVVLMVCESHDFNTPKHQTLQFRHENDVRDALTTKTLHFWKLDQHSTMCACKLWYCCCMFPILLRYELHLRGQCSWWLSHRQSCSNSHIQVPAHTHTHLS